MLASPHPIRSSPSRTAGRGGPGRAARAARPVARAARPVAVTLLALLAALAALLAGAGPAAAHASLIDNQPAMDEVLDTQPDEVVLNFSEEVATSADSIRVLDPDGTRIDTAEIERRPADQGTAYGVPLASDLPDGTYTVAWQVTSADSHPVAGAFTFSIGAPSQTAVNAEEMGAAAEDPTVALLYDIARFVSYAGFLLLVGAGVFVLRCWPGAAALGMVRRLATGAWTALTAATMALLLLRQPYATGGGLGDALGVSALSEVLDTRIGTALAARLLLLAVAGLFLAVLFGPYARARAGAVDGTPPAAGELGDLTAALAVGGGILALGISATWAMAEHASTGPQTGVAIPADMAHLIAAAAWLGGLAVLLSLLFRGASPVPREAVLRFSTIALVSVGVLAATGLYQSWRQVQSWDALFTTSYGQLLLVKVALVALLLGGGWFSRQWTARLTDPDTVAGGPAANPAAPGSDGGDPNGGDRRGGDGRGGGDAERAAQLARQRAAVARTRQRQTRDADSVRSGLRRSVLTETGIAVLLIAVTTGLTGTVPARVAAEEEQTASVPDDNDLGPITLVLPFDTGGEGGQGTAYIDIDPGDIGDNTLHIRTLGPDDAPLPAEEIRVSVTLPAEDLGPLRYDSPPLIDIGHWTQPEFQLPRPGDWEFSLTIRTSDIDQVTEQETISIG